jgi:uncharacterized RDD family membrane protein YckC
VTTFEVIVGAADPTMVLTLDLCNTCQRTMAVQDLKKRWTDMFGGCIIVEPPGDLPEPEPPERKYIAGPE